MRLVWAPEQQAAFFGGDPDNFEFPRFNLDATVYRAYENGQPAKIQHYLKWSQAGTKEGDLTFVSGHPGSTNRQFTMAELQFLRDTQYPYIVPRLKRLEVLLKSWGDRSEENARRAKDDLFGVQNSRKVYDGRQAGLFSPAIMEPKAAQEKSFKQQVGDRADGAAVRAAYDRLAETAIAQAKIYRRYRLLEGGHAFMSDSFGFARSLLRAGDERPSPTASASANSATPARPRSSKTCFPRKPVYADLEIVLLSRRTHVLRRDSRASTILSSSKVLAGQSPRDRAAALINGTKVRDVAVRKKLYEGGAAAVTAAKDPLIELARLVDAESRALRKQWEAADETKQQAHATIEKARFAIEGPGRSPDATFTLRLSYGPVKGYTEGGNKIPALHHARRHLRPQQRAQGQGALRSAEALARQEVRAQPQHAL